jgi:hypothetical protein
MDRKEQQLRTKTIPIVKVLWQNHDVEEASWELEQEMRNRYPYLFEGLEQNPSQHYIFMLAIFGWLR